MPPGEWAYTDDTEMAISIASTLKKHGRIDPDALAAKFSQRYNPWRGYGAGAHVLMQALRRGADWRVEARQMFGGQGSYGNGAAMRIAPCGAFFADDLEAARENAEISARVTHAHPEGVAGAAAVALAAALAFRIGEGDPVSREQFFEKVVGSLPEGLTRDRIEKAAELSPSVSPTEAAGILGSGYQVSAQDTVPFTLWYAARHFDDYEEAFWATVSGLGDRDTTCAIVGGIVALSARRKGIPTSWLESREPLD